MASKVNELCGCPSTKDNLGLVESPDSTLSVTSPASHRRRRRGSLKSTQYEKKELKEEDRSSEENIEKPRMDSPVDKITKDGRRIVKDDRLEESKIRERLKSMPGLKKEGTERRSRGPMVAKPNVLSLSSTTLSSNASSQGSRSGSSNGPSGSGGSKRYTRTPSPSYTDSAFTRQVVSRPNSPVSRKSPVHSVYSKHSSGNSGRRTPSPSSVLDPILNSDVAKKRVLKALKARLYLLQQIGPNSLLIGGDSPNHKFKVIIGPQTCSCGKAPHCIHLLFVMLRVFQVSEQDPCLWNKTLKNYEVESLFSRFYNRREKKNKSVLPSCRKEKERDSNLSSSQESLSGSDRGKDEDEDLCPICLLEMIDGESLVTCEEGCQNKLHHHCIAIWFEECKTQNEPLICPLCRTEWSIKQLNERITKSNCDDHRSPSPPNVPDANDMFLPRADDIPAEHLVKAGPWIQVFGEDLISCFFSRNWVVRETALPHLSQRVISALSGETGDSVNTAGVPLPTKEEIVSNCCAILAMVCGDPVYKVFVAALKCLRNTLSHVVCTTEEEISWLKKCLSPIVETVLTKCADAHRRTSQLSLSTLEELAKGQHGELAIGRKSGSQDVVGMDDGVDFILRCILQEYSEYSVLWQWLLGRLYMVDRLIDRFPAQFILRQRGAGQDEGSETPVNYDRLVSVLKFALREVNNAHIRIGKVARRVFILGARLTAHVREVFVQVESMLSSLDRSLHVTMKRRLSVVASEFTVAQQVALMVQREPAYDKCDSVAAIKQENQEPERTLVPEVPPNSPRFRRRRHSASPSKRRIVSITRKRKSSKSRQEGNEESSKELMLPEGHLTPPPTPKMVAEQNNAGSQFEFTNDPSSPQGSRHQQAFKALQLSPTIFDKNSNYLCHHTVNIPTSREYDSSDVTLSPSTPEDKLVSFKSEVALSPKRNVKALKLPLDTTGWYNGQGCYHCKEKIEEEEMIALACAVEASRCQDKLPFIPGLSCKPSESAAIRIQPEPDEEEDSKPTGHFYQEDKDWSKGPVLGTGAFSTCYQARDSKTGTIMAVKQMAFCRNSGSDQEKVVDSIKEEFGLMTKLNHPNIVRILGATQEGYHFNMFVEWMSGGSVAYLLDKYGAFSEMVIISYTLQVLKGLAYLHDNHILHRDLKGANLLVDSSGKQIRIADFGASAKLSSHRTQAGEFKGQLLGTIAFMAPEVLRGENYGRSCDVWSVGCVIIEMATCKPPWNANDLSNHLALIFKIASATKPPPIPDFLSPPIKDLLLRCLEHNSEDRPPVTELLKHSLFTQYHRAVVDTGD